MDAEFEHDQHTYYILYIAHRIRIGDFTISTLFVGNDDFASSSVVFKV